MPLIGYFLGVGLENKIRAFDHWIAFVLAVGVSFAFSGVNILLGVKILAEHLIGG